MGERSLPVATRRDDSRNSKARGDRDSRTDASTENPKRQCARTAIGSPRSIDSRTVWPSKVPPPAAICKRSRKRHSSHSETSPATPTPSPTEEAGDKQHMSRSSASNKVGMQTVQENSGMKCNYFDILVVDSNPDLPPMAVHLMMTRRCTSTYGCVVSTTSDSTNIAVEL